MVIFFRVWDVPKVTLLLDEFAFNIEVPPAFIKSLSALFPNVNEPDVVISPNELKVKAACPFGLLMLPPGAPVVPNIILSVAVKSDPETIRDPVIVWFPLNWFEPVVA